MMCHSLLKQMHRLEVDFYTRKTETVARELLGKYLVKELLPEEKKACPATEILIARLVETEAYTQDDPAAHAYKGPNPRNKVLFQRGGYAYVYFIYGKYYCLNVVTEKEGSGGAVLIRAAEPLAGMECMWARRFPHKPFSHTRLRTLLAGPGKICTAFGITREKHNGASLLSGELTLWEKPADPKPEIAVSPRIGITKARERMGRFTIADNPYISMWQADARRRSRRSSSV